MGQTDFERLNREELIEFVLRLLHSAKTPCTSSEPPPADR
jgi:hypothetical protein